MKIMYYLRISPSLISLKWNHNKSAISQLKIRLWWTISSVTLHLVSRILFPSQISQVIWTNPLILLMEVASLAICQSVIRLYNQNPPWAKERLYILKVISMEWLVWERYLRHPQWEERQSQLEARFRLQYMVRWGSIVHLHYHQLLRREA